METSSVATKAIDGGGKSRPRSLIRKRPVYYGISRNYHGNVYTIPSDDSDDNSESDSNNEENADIESALGPSSAVNRRIVAMIGVPPEHVPEGVLSLIRSHRPFVEHIRVMISESESDDEDEDEREEEKDQSENTNRGEDEKEETDDAIKTNRSSFDLDDDIIQRKDRTYLILVQLLREEDAVTFVEDLDGEPYIAFDDRDTCQIERVACIETYETMQGTETKEDFLSGHGGIRKSQSLPLLHPNFGTTIIDRSNEGGPPQEQKQKVDQESSKIRTKWTNISPQKREDFSFNCAVCLENLTPEEQKMDDIHSLLAATARTASTICALATTPLKEQQQQQQQSSLLTTVCNHTFHLDCLQQCTGPCPVCRYDHSGLNETLSECHVCGSTEYNYVCLICGVVSCGIPHTAASVPPVAAAAASSSTSSASSSAQQQADPPRFYTSSHAGQHYRDTLHAYALDTQTQHVYDFCGQGYVHRLVQNEEDGKLVEVNDPNSLARGMDSPGERSLLPGLSDSQEGEVVHRKLEGAAEQYNNLLKSQLQQQRAYYEEGLNQMKREFSAEHQKARAQDLISVLRQEKKQANQRLSSLQRRKAKIDENAAFMTNMNESIESNKLALKHQVQQVARERLESETRSQDNLQRLEAKANELMIELTESMDD